MEQKIALLINIAAQKLVKYSLAAYNLQLQGYPAEDEFCWLTKLQASIAALKSGMDLSLRDLEDLEEIIRNIGDKENIPYRPVVVQPEVEIKPKDCCCDDSDIQDRIDDILEQINYEKPWLELTPIGLDAGKYEVGHGLKMIDVNWKANKVPLDYIRVNFPADPQRVSPNLVGTHSGITIDLRPADELVLKIYGWYNDRQQYKGKHLLAEDELCFKTKWPCYWGVGPMDALDNEGTVNLFALGLTRELCCPGCVDADLGEGEVLYFFFPYKGKEKQFVTDNGVIHNSFKGTVDGFKTQSLITNSLPGDTVYGVIRTDQPGIGPLRVCIREVEWPVGEPEPVPVEPDETVVYEGIWKTVRCVKVNETYEGTWLDHVCVKEDL